MQLLIEEKVEEAVIVMEGYLDVSERTVLAAFTRHNFC